ncbi:uncharacterized protein LOC113851078 [Abrus precatorius]|uniref:Uncharacterized protein LOC113851078 n=1 Tax=Abrus precatorius TaxID=3816 RepID=A0A8B8K155_ABRPR|nr:uncharacterized protein LOC113851078 [Abrus precatorius]
MMEWSSKYAARAYLDTLQLCNNHKRQYGTWRIQEPGRNEFVSALAAGMKAKLILEVTSRVSLSTIALAAAARYTGGKLVCILPETVLDESKEVINNSGLEDQVEFRTEDPSKLLPYYENIDFFLVDCKDENYTRLLNLVDVNPTRSIVVAKNLGGDGDKKGLGGYLRVKDKKLAVRSLKLPLGKGMQVTRISNNDDSNERHGIRGEYSRKWRKSSWVVKYDEESGEEHIYRVPQVDWFWG